jgi:hypothetical protein
LEHQINQSKRKFFQKKYVWYLKSVKEPNIRMGATRRNLQAQNPKQIAGTPKLPIKTKVLPKKVCLQTQPKILKKLPKQQIYQSKRKFSQKNVCLVPFK